MGGGCGCRVWTGERMESVEEGRERRRVRGGGKKYLYLGGWGYLYSEEIGKSH
jgi:hypothetical protein